MTKYLFEDLAPEYKRLWDSMVITKGMSELQRIVRLYEAHKEPYLKVEKATGVPAYVVYIIHIREAGEGDVGKFRGVLHDGEHIIGSGKVTQLEPRGRGPFATWHDAALDALKIKGMWNSQHPSWSDWSPERILFYLEPYNGYGYRMKGKTNPYLWSFSNHYTKGKYVRDHVYDSEIVDSQPGCAPLLRLFLNRKTSDSPTNNDTSVTINPPVVDTTNTPAIKKPATLSWLAGAWASAVGFFHSYWLELLLGGCGIVLVWYLWHRYRVHKLAVPVSTVNVAEHEVSKDTKDQDSPA